MSYSFRFYKLQGSCIRRKFDLILLTSFFFFFSSLLRDIFHPPLTCLVFWRGERRKIVQLSSSYVRVDVSVPSVCWRCRWQTGVRSSSSQGSWLLDLWLSLLRCQRANPQVLGDWIWLFLSFILWVCAFSWLILSPPPQKSRRLRCVAVQQGGQQGWSLGGIRTTAWTLCSLFDPILQDQGESHRVGAPGGWGKLEAFTAANSLGLLP